MKMLGSIVDRLLGQSYRYAAMEALKNFYRAKYEALDRWDKHLETFIAPETLLEERRKFLELEMQNACGKK